MDLDARLSCLRSVALIARSARLCASIEPGSDQFQSARESAIRMQERAETYYVTMRGEHADHERPIRVVRAALIAARGCVTELTAREVDGNNLLLQAEKTERAIERAGAISVEQD